MLEIEMLQARRLKKSFLFDQSLRPPFFQYDKPLEGNYRFIELSIPRSCTTLAYMVSPKAANILLNGLTVHGLGGRFFFGSAFELKPVHQYFHPRRMSTEGKTKSSGTLYFPPSLC